MLNFLQQCFVVFARLPWRHAFNSLIVVMLLLSVVLALLACLRPVQMHHYRNIMTIATQSQMPRSQKMAQHLLRQPVIHLANYLKLMHALQYEQAQLQYYPAIDVAPAHKNLVLPSSREPNP